MKRSLAFKLILAAILSLTIPVFSDSPKELEDLLAATFTPATAQAQKLATIIETYFQAGTQGTLRYGDRVRLRHSLTGYHLHGLNKPSSVQGSTKRLMAVAAKDAGSWWIVKGGHVDGKRLTGDMWMPVTQGSILRLEQEGTGLNVHSQDNIFVPIRPELKDKKNLLEVSIFGTAGIGNIDDNWKLTDIKATADGITDIKIGTLIKLSHVQTKGFLYSDASRRYPDGFQEVTTQTTSDDSNWWIVEDIVPASAPDLNIFYAVYGDLNNTEESKRTIVTNKLDAMTYNGTLRFPVQAIPHQPDMTIFKTFNIADPSPDTIKNIAIIYGANSSLYVHFALSEYDILALPDFRDPKLFDLSRIPQIKSDLKILYAIHGDLNCTAIGKNGGIGDSSTAIQNVTDKIQALIKNNQIIFDSSPKSEIFNPSTTTPAPVPIPTPPIAPVPPLTTPSGSGSPAKTSESITPILNPNKGLLIIYQAGNNIYLRFIGENQSGLLSATNHNQSTLVYTPPTIVNTPAGFVMEVGSAGRIAVGSSAGDLGVFALSTRKDVIQSYNPYNLTGDPWTIIPMPKAKYPALKLFRDISFSSDNVLLLLDSNGKAYRYDMQKKTLVQLSVGPGNEKLALDGIAAGNSRNVWAVDAKSKTLYSYIANKWVKVPEQQSVYVAAGYDKTAVSINPAGDAFLFDGNTWKIMPGSKLDRVAICNKANIWGIRNGQLLVFTAKGWRYIRGNDGKVASGFKEIDINAAGTVFATTAEGKIYYKGEAGFLSKTIIGQDPKTKLSPIQFTGRPVISPKVTRARAMQQGKLIIDISTQTKAGKLAKLKVKNPRKN